MGRVGARRACAVVLAALLALATTAVALAANDPHRSEQWYLDRIGAPEAWPTSQGQEIVIAIVDSGVNLTHPDLVDRFVRTADGRVKGRDFVDGDDVPEDEHGHGTMVAGIAAATMDNGYGIAGVAPRARLLPVRVLDAEGRGSQSNVDLGIRWAVDNGARVINLSLESALPKQAGLVGIGAPVDAVQYAWERGVVVVAATGNSGESGQDYPASSPVLLVGATDRNDRRSSFSGGGRENMIMAPGEEIRSTWCREDGDDGCHPDTHTIGIASGTSFAAPQVSAGIAMLRQLGLSHQQAVERLRATARDLGPDGPDAEYGVGLLDLSAATAAFRTAGAESPSPTASPSPTTDPTPSPTASPTPSPAPDGSPPASEPSEPEPTEPSPTELEPTDPEPTDPEPTEAEPTDVAPTDPRRLPDVAEVDAAPTSLDDPARDPWVALALLLLVANGVAVGRALTSRSGFEPAS
jgi:subtilisin family serine protease